MTAFLKYSLARFVILIACVAPALLIYPDAGPGVVLVKLLIAFVVSAALSYFLLRQWRDEVADQMMLSTRERVDRKERLRAALAGEDDPASPDSSPPAPRSPEKDPKPPSTEDGRRP